MGLRNIFKNAGKETVFIFNEPKGFSKPRKSKAKKKRENKARAVQAKINKTWKKAKH